MLINPGCIKKILLVNLAHIGDIVLATPLTRALRRTYPYSDIDILVQPLVNEAARHNPYINRVYSYNIDNWIKDRIKLLKLIQLLQHKKYDLALTTSFGSLEPMLLWLSGAKMRVGFDTYKSTRFLTHAVCAIRTIIKHETENQLEVLKPLGITTSDTNIAFRVTADDVTNLHRKLPLTYNKPLVLLCPLSSNPQKNWTISSYVKVLQHLAKFAQCFLVGSYEQTSDLEQINADADNCAEVLGGSLSLGELGALINEADLLITVDTGILHIAQAFKTPVLALFGPTDPRVWGPRGPYDVVLHASLNCSPCWHKTDDSKNRCTKNICMEQIQVTDVLQTAENMLKAHNKKGEG